MGAYVDAVGSHGFVYDGNTYTTLDVPNEKAGPGKTFGTAAYGVWGNTIVGTYAASGVSHGFVYHGGTFMTLDDPAAVAPGGTVALGNSDGTIVGNYGNGGSLGFVATPEPRPDGLAAIAAALLLPRRRRRHSRDRRG